MKPGCGLTQFGFDVLDALPGLNGRRTGYRAVNGFLAGDFMGAGAGPGRHEDEFIEW